MALSQEEQLLLRRCFDEGRSKRDTMRATGISEATVYRYFVRWAALNRDVIDLEDVPKPIMDELKIQAGMRCMKPYEFVIRLLTITVEDNLSKAIFDIHETDPTKKRLANET
jgi:hypothetical protein